MRKHHGKAAATAHRLIVMLGALCRLFVFGVRRLHSADAAEAIAFHLKLLRWSAVGLADEGIVTHTRSAA